MLLPLLPVISAFLAAPDNCVTVYGAAAGTARTFLRALADITEKALRRRKPNLSVWVSERKIILITLKGGGSNGISRIVY